MTSIREPVCYVFALSATDTSPFMQWSAPYMRIQTSYRKVYDNSPNSPIVDDQN